MNRIYRCRWAVVYNITYSTVLQYKQKPDRYPANEQWVML